MRIMYKKKIGSTDSKSVKFSLLFRIQCKYCLDCIIETMTNSKNMYTNTIIEFIIFSCIQTRPSQVKDRMRIRF